MVTEEYHNELYGELEYTFWDNPSNAQLKRNQITFDNEFFGNKCQEKINSPFKGGENKVTIHTYIRNKIHHAKENSGRPTTEELRQSIDKMRGFFDTSADHKTSMKV